MTTLVCHVGGKRRVYLRRALCLPTHDSHSTAYLVPRLRENLLLAVLLSALLQEGEKDCHVIIVNTNASFYIISVGACVHFKLCG